MVPSLKFFWMTLCISTKSSALISNMTRLFKYSPQNYPSKVNLVPKISFFVLCETLHFDKFESADFKSGNKVFQISA